MTNYAAAIMPGIDEDLHDLLDAYGRRNWNLIGYQPFNGEVRSQYVPNMVLIFQKDQAGRRERVIRNFGKYYVYDPETHADKVADTLG